MIKWNISVKIWYLGLMFFLYGYIYSVNFIVFFNIYIYYFFSVFVVDVYVFVNWKIVKKFNDKYLLYVF